MIFDADAEAREYLGSLTPVPLVGLAGAGRSGKDTAADGLGGWGFQRVAFADPLRALALRLDPMMEVRGPGGRGLSYTGLSALVERLGWDTAKAASKDVRAYLVALGHGVRETVDEGVWQRAAMARVDATSSPVVVTDVRYASEAETIRERGGVVLRVDRPGVAPANEHEAEFLAEFVPDGIIGNTRGVERLHAMTRTAVWAQFV